MASHVRTTIRYDGPELAHHEMDVQDLAPALLALAEIVQIANRQFNGDAAAIRVLVNADVEQKCFQIDLSLVQSLLEQAKGLFTPDDVKTAEDIGKIIGLVSGGAVGLFKFIKWMTAKKDGGGTAFSVKAKTGSTVILVNGDGNTINVPQDVYELASNAAVVENVKRVVRPLTKPGYESLAFFEGDKVVDRLTRDEANHIVLMTAEPITTATDTLSKITGPVRIKTPQYVGNAKWGVLWGGKTIEVTMPVDWVRQFQQNLVDAPPGTVLKVKMDQATPLDENGEAAGSPTYTVTEISEVTPPVKQSSLLDRLPPP